MAIAFRSVGARLKADVSGSGANQSLALPPGHTAGDYLMMFVISDDNTGLVANPTGWTKGVSGSAGTSSQSPYNAAPRVSFYGRIDNGALGSSVPLKFSTSAWPAGDPWVLAFIVAYSGVDNALPIDQWWYQYTASTSAAQTHHALTTSVANDWLVHVRASSANGAATFTDSVGTDVERLDDTDGFGELSAALYDTNGPVATIGAQTARTTTASRTCDYGSVVFSIALKAPSATGTTSAASGEADVSASAYGPTVVTQDGPWALCSGNLPRYRVAIDWGGDGSLIDSTSMGATYVSDTFGRTVSSGWGAADTGQAWTVGSTASDFSVTPGAGVHSLNTVGASRFATLDVPSNDVDLAVDFATSATAVGANQVIYLMARYTDGSNFYYTRINLTTANTITLGLRVRVAGVETEPALFTTALTHTAGTFYTVRLRVVGSTLWAKLWQTGSPEPGWQVSASDTSLPPGSKAGVRSLLSTGNTNTLPVQVSFDNFRATQPVDTDDVTGDVISDISVTYGRDQERQLAPAAVGTASLSLLNADRTYSPENAASPLAGDLDPARAMQATVAWNGQTYSLFTGRIDDYTVKADYADRTVDLSFLDGLNDLAGGSLSTEVYASLRTGDLINVVLDKAGWTGGRDIDTGVTVVKYWWLDGTDALTAINDLVKSEGPPAIAYVAPSGTFVFRDRHHRMLRQNSKTAQAVLHAGALGECTDQGVPDGALSLARPFTYAHGWKDIVNSVSFDVADRAPSAGLQQVWQDDVVRTLALGESVDLTVSSSDPFVNAVTPVVGTDVTYTGSGVLGLLLSRTSGLSARLTLSAIGGPVTVTFLQVRARLMTVQQTTRVSQRDPGSIGRHGERSYPNDAPWAGAEDAKAIATAVLLHYAERRPTVQVRLVSSDPAHFVQVLSRTVSDRVRIVNEELGLDSDFFVERVTHAVQRTGTTGRPPVHSVVLGCEKDLGSAVSANPFTFDKRGAGFDQGIFDPLQADDASQVFIFDDPVQGLFDVGEYGT